MVGFLLGKTQHCVTTAQSFGNLRLFFCAKQRSFFEAARLIEQSRSSTNSTIYLLISSSVPDKESTRMHRKRRISALGAWRSGLALGWQTLTDRIPSLVRLS